MNEIAVLDGLCRKSCEGLYVTSYFKSKMDETLFANFWAKVEKDYMKYKARGKTVDFPADLQGRQ